MFSPTQRGVISGGMVLSIKDAEEELKNFSVAAEEKNLQKKFFAKFAGGRSTLDLKKENELLRAKIDQIKPTLKELIQELKETKEKLEENARHRELLDEKLKAREQEKRQIEKDFEAAIDLKRKAELQIEELKSKIGLLSFDFSQKITLLEKQQIQKESEFQETLTLSYQQLRNLAEKNASLNQQCSLLHKKVEEKKLKEGPPAVEEQGIELRKLQLHLAKKLKENALARDLLERQKHQIIELQNNLAFYKSELEKVLQSEQTQKSKEESLEVRLKDEVAKAELLVQEWQKKYEKQQEKILLLEKKLAGLSSFLSQANEIASVAIE